MSVVSFPTERKEPKRDGVWVEQPEGPIVHLDFLAREDGSQYARTEYENGYIEFEEREDFMAKGGSDFWDAGGLAAMMEKKVREFAAKNEGK